MFVPNSIIASRLASENVGLWLDYDRTSLTIGIIVKLPTMAIKSILLGAPTIIHFAMTSGDDNYMSLGMSVKDTDDVPLIFVRPIKDEIESPGLIHLINENFARISITFFNDLNHSVAYGVVSLDVEIISEVKTWLLNGFRAPASYALLNILADSFYSELVKNYICDKKWPTRVASQMMEINELKSYPMSVYDNRLPSMYYDLSVGKDGSEGYVQEEMIARSLASLFRGDVIQSPLIMHGNKKRELTDVLAMDDLNVLLIESKSSGVVERGKLVSFSRSKSTTNRLLKEALGQIIGVAKKCSLGIKLVDCEREVEINAGHNKHIIIIIPELSLVEDGEPNQKVRKIYETTGCKVHVLDMHALINFIKLSRNHPPLFWAQLEDRFTCAYDNKTFNIQDVDSSLPM
ncbi:hypothetical protein IB221_04380 [Pantoea sp. PNT01]|uniref:hypothetical protein n=1 Tax=Pantoea sp. PNT01 TaxID=2769271 RepID=UPI001785B249|nr:hypothetical protein [Pantoea sp. PNT01]MBD9551502.1 hypothetical protein [Pantoea sp. PNT01]